MYTFKRYNIFILSLLLMVAFNIKAKTTLNLWAFTDELKVNGSITKYEEMYPDVEVKLSIFSLENYLAKLKPALRRPQNAPDIFLAEAGIVKELVNSKYYLTLNEQKDIMAAKDDYVPYVWELGKNAKGELKALSWQATPGGFFYRRSYAKKYLGSDDPKVVAEAISTWDKFLETARKIKQASNGEVKMIGGGPDLFHVFAKNRTEGYIKDGKFNLDPKMIQWLKLYKTMYQEELTYRASPFTPAWITGMKKGIFGYFLPTWGLYYVLKQNAPETSGDWGLTAPTESFFWGGTWLGVYYKSKHKKEALNFIKMQAFDKDYMLNWVNKTGDFVSRTSVQNQINNTKSAFLNNQDHYQFFKNEAPQIKSNTISKYDIAIDGFLQSEALQYANGSQDLDATIENIKKNVFNAYRLK